MDFTQKVSLAPHVMFQNFDSESILVDVRTQEHFALDPISSLLFTQINEGLSLKESFNTILESYDVSAEQLSTDLNTLLNELLKYELIKVT